MIKSLLLFGVALCVFASCTILQHPTKTQADLDRERKECARYVAENPDPDATCRKDAEDYCVTCEQIKRCLEDQKGWKRVRF